VALPAFAKHSTVQRKSQRDQIGAVIAEATEIADQWWYRVRFADGIVRNVPEVDLELYEDPTDVWSLLARGSFSNKKTLSKLITFTKLQVPLRNNLYALSSSRTRFFSYQFKPVLKFLESEFQRLLIADEVGLGKTIEAGLIMREMRARHDMARVLIVCPSSLSGKWKFELALRFQEDFRILDSKGFREFTDEFQRDGETRLQAVCTLQTLRGRQVLAAIEAASIPFDLVIIDEAHHMRNAETLSSRAGRILSETADAMLLLTATPVHLGNRDLFNLLAILKPEEFDNYALFESRMKPAEYVNKALRLLRKSPPPVDECSAVLKKLEEGGQAGRYTGNPIYAMVMERLIRSVHPNHREIVELQRDITHLSPLAHILSRTRKRDTGVYAIRTAMPRRPEFTDAEMDFYNGVTSYVIREYQRRSDLGGFAAFVTMMPQRQVASCIPAMIQYYHAKFEQENDTVDTAETSDLSLEDFGDDQGELFEPDPQATMTLREVVAMAANLGNTDSKFDLFLSDLKALEEAEPGRKILVFSYFKATLRYLSERLQDAGFRNMVMSGDDPPISERLAHIKRFEEDPTVRVLLSSEVGSEGLDLQFCSVIVNYDLPWNPMVVEQRIGRLDRIGQKADRILIYNYSVPGTIEDRILTRLYARIGIFEKSVGDLEAILGDEIQRLTRDLLTTQLTPAEQERRLDQAAKVIFQRQMEIEALDEGASQLIAHDQFFEDEIAAIRQKRRFVSPEELHTFFTEFLATVMPEVSVSRSSPGIYQVGNVGRLLDLVRLQLPNVDKERINFLARVGNKTRLMVTFDPDQALRDSSTEFITIYHPVIRAIVRYYDQNRQQMHPVSAIRLTATNDLPAGSYLFALFLVENTGARPGTSLEGAFWDLQKHRAVDADTAETMISQIVTDAQTLQELVVLNPDDVINGKDELLQDLGKRMGRQQEELSRFNEAVVGNRLASLNQSFEIKIRKKQDLLAKARASGRAAPQYIRMLEGGLRNLERDLELKRSQIEAERGVQVSFSEIAAGLLKVEP
jgi:superfamily II DNA or RNA helicase